jgi:hypothetical protein
VFHGKIEDKPVKKKKRKPKTTPRYRVPAPLPEIPNGDPILLTKETMDLLRTPHGGFTSKTIQALGVPDTKKKWIHKLYGSTLSREVFVQAAKGRTMWSDKPSPFIAC